MTIDTEATGRKPAGKKKIAVAALFASSIEWYDFLIYGTAAALVFSTAFFPDASPVAGVLASFGTFAVGFVARPFGGVIFGHFGDKIGRKRALLIALILMATATVLIGALPTYAMVGAFAPILLILLRVLQGIAIGGQWGGAMLLVTEQAPSNRRGLYGSIPQLGVPIGLVLGTTIFLFLTTVLSDEAFYAWGWRIPFLLSVVMAFVVYYIHHFIQESPEFREAEQHREENPEPEPSPILEVLRTHASTVIFAGLALLSAQALFYIVVTGIVDYGTRDLGMNKSQLLLAVLFSMIGFLIGAPLSALASDIFGRKRIFAIGLLAMGMWSPMVFPLVNTQGVGQLFLALLVSQLTIGMVLGPLPAFFAELFDAKIRYSGASLAYQIGAILGGGLAPFIMVWILSSTDGQTRYVTVYIVSAVVVSLVALLALRSTDKMSSAPEDTAPETAPAHQ